MHIRDPIHGAIELTPDERALVDSPQYQRLRNVKQLGFADLAFPGATHTRYAHGLGAMAMATKVFDAVAPQLALDADDRARFRQTLRLAVLFHDLGHAPLSHATEAIMPPVADLRVPEWARESGTRRAGHEDYTLKLVLDSALAAEIRRRFSSGGIEPEHIAGLICGRPRPRAYPIRGGGAGPLPFLFPGGLRRAGCGPDGLPAAGLVLHGRELREVRRGLDRAEPRRRAAGRPRLSGLAAPGRVRVRGLPPLPLPHVPLRLLSLHLGRLRGAAPEVVRERGVRPPGGRRRVLAARRRPPARGAARLQQSVGPPHRAPARVPCADGERARRRSAAVASDAAPARAGRRRRVRHGQPRRALALWEGSDALGEVAARRGADRRVHAALRALRGSGDAGALVRRAGEVGRSAPASHFGVSGRTYPANGADAMPRA